MSKYTNLEKRKLAIEMMHFCERLWDEFTDYCDINEELFDEMLSELEDLTIDD